MKFEKHNYHLVDPSPWPLIGAIAALILAVGAIMFHLVKDIIILGKLPAYYLELFIGLVIVFGVTLNQIAKKKY